MGVDLSRTDDQHRFGMMGAHDRLWGVRDIAREQSEEGEDKNDSDERLLQISPNHKRLQREEVGIDVVAFTGLEGEFRLYLSAGHPCRVALHTGDGRDSQLAGSKWLPPSVTHINLQDPHAAPPPSLLSPLGVSDSVSSRRVGLIIRLQQYSTASNDEVRSEATASTQPMPPSSQLDGRRALLQLLSSPCRYSWRPF
jgi:hypothetical protein